MSQFTESQMVTVRTAIEFLAETQQAHHGHVTADVQEIFDLFNPVFEDEPAAELPADVVEPTEEEIEAHFAEEAVEEVAAEEAPAAE